MGCRVTDNLKNSQYTMRYIEVSPAGIERLTQRGIKVSRWRIRFQEQIL